MISSQLLTVFLATAAVQIFNPVSSQLGGFNLFDSLPSLSSLDQSNSQSRSVLEPLTKLHQGGLPIFGNNAKNPLQSRYGNQDPITGFLGVDSLANPTIKLKKEESDSPLPEPVCERSYYMGPFSEPRHIHANASVKLRLDPTCAWNIFGTEACIPLIQCPYFKLDGRDKKTRECKEYLELYDGYKGLKKYCGDAGPVNVTAASGLRDLFIKFHTTKHEGKDNPKIGEILKFNCSVSCANRKQGQPLPIKFTPKSNELCSCGVKGDQNRVIGGELAENGEFPWLVGLVQKNTRQVFCGGTLINDRMVLTAAHCIKGLFLNINNLQVLINAFHVDTLPNMHVVQSKPSPKVYNETVLKEKDAEDKSLRFGLEEIMVHPLYVSETNQYDVALLKLATPVKLGTAVSSPICLPEPGSFMRTFAARNATIAGWGLTSESANETSPTLQKLRVNVFPPSKCKKFYAHRVTRRSLCAGYEKGGKDSCMGDSGGPLITQDKPDVWFQIGIVSWGEGCAASENPGVYFRTTECAPWVYYQSNRNGAVWCDVPK